MNKLTKSKFFRDPQNIIALGVTIISLCALIISLVQTSLLKEEGELMREQARASVWPHLELNLEIGHNLKDSSINHFVLKINNNGVGPAIITDVKVSYNGTIAKNWWDLFDIQKIPDSVDRQISNRSFNEQVIKIGETIEILNLNANLPLAGELSRRLEDLSIDIYYKSIYGEIWKNYDGSKTIKLENFEGLPKEEQFW
jgi:hypothetical protein